jgi:hypothetical protein
MATQPTPKPNDQSTPGFLDVLKREAGAFGQAVNPVNFATSLYHAAADPARPGEDANFENKIGPTGRLVDRMLLQPTVNAAKDYAGGKVSYDNVLQNAPEALGFAGGGSALGGLINSAVGAAGGERVPTAPTKPTLSPTGEIAWPESYKNPPAGGGGNYTASDLAALKKRMGIDSEPAEQTPQPYAGIERRAEPRTSPKTAAQVEEDIKLRRPTTTPFDETEGAMATINRDPNMPQHPALQGGHAGNGVASVEELSRPGLNYVVSRNGLTYHGKSFAPETTPIGGAHVTVLPDGQLRVNEGNLTPALANMLQRGLAIK